MGTAETPNAIQLIALLTVLSHRDPDHDDLVHPDRGGAIVAAHAAPRPRRRIPSSLRWRYLTAFVMGPVLQKSHDDGIKPLVANQTASRTRCRRPRACAASRKRTREKDLKLFMDLSAEPPPATPADMSLRILCRRS
jgi:flagellar biosynthetic protein FliP